jgi:uncharacterized membrane protein YphA (DoxX/SURF4 family)
MKRRLIGYWIATGLLGLIMGVSGVLALSHRPGYAQALAHLGYPRYFSNLLGVGKLAGVVVLLAPGMARWKEWAYAAFGVVVVSAAYSHFQSGDGWLRAAEPLLVAGTALVISYRLRPADRRLAGFSSANLTGEDALNKGAWKVREVS